MSVPNRTRGTDDKKLGCNTNLMAHLVGVVTVKMCSQDCKHKKYLHSQPGARATGLHKLHKLGHIHLFTTSDTCTNISLVVPPFEVVKQRQSLLLVEHGGFAVPGLELAHLLLVHGLHDAVALVAFLGDLGDALDGQGLQGLTGGLVVRLQELCVQRSGVEVN